MKRWCSDYTLDIHNTAQHSTAPHSTAQHSTTQHNTTQRNNRAGMNLDIPVALGAGNPHAFSVVTVGCAFLGGSWYGLSVAYANGWVRRDKRKRMADVTALQRIFEVATFGALHMFAPPCFRPA